MSNPRIPCGYQVEPPTAVQPPVRPAPDRPGDRDQQQAAEVARNVRWASVAMEYDTATAIVEAALAAARAEEAARWQAKIEALADEWRNGPFADAAVFAPSSCARRLRAVLDGEQR